MIRVLTPRWFAAGLLLLSSLAATGVASSLTLDEAIDIALAGNPDLAVLRHRTSAAAAAVQEAKSAWYPSLTASAAYTRTDNPPQAFFMNLNQRSASLDRDFNQPGETDNIRGSLGFSMLLLDGGPRGLGIQAAQRSEQASVEQITAARNNLKAEVTRAFFAARQAEGFVVIQEESMATLTSSLQVARDRYDAGSVQRSDVLNLETRLAAAREDILLARHRIQLARTGLNLALGDDVVTATTSLVSPEQDPAPPSPHLDLDVIDQRPEWLAAAHHVEAATLAGRRTQRDRLPKLSAFGSADWDSDRLSDVEQSYLIGAVVDVDLFTGYRRSAQVARHEAQRLEAVAQQQALAHALRLDLQRAHLGALSAWERIAVAEQSVSSAAEAYRITRERYQEGSAEITELMAAQLQNTSARHRAVTARYDYWTAIAELERAQGGTSLHKEETP